MRRAIGCLRVDSVESLPDIYPAVRKELEGRDDLDQSAWAMTSSSRNISTASSSTSTSCSSTASAYSRASPRTGRRRSRRFWRPASTARRTTARKKSGSSSIWAPRTVQAFGSERGVLHVEGKCTSPRGHASSRSTPVWAAGGSIRSSRRCGGWTSSRRSCVPRSVCRSRLAAEPEASLCRGPRDRLRPGDRPAGGAPVRGGEAGGRPRALHRRPDRGG